MGPRSGGSDLEKPGSALRKAGENAKGKKESLVWTAQRKAWGNRPPAVANGVLEDHRTTPDPDSCPRTASSWFCEFRELP